MIIKRKIFTKFDDTDRLKQMKDSDILAEKRKKAPGYGQALGAAAGGVAVGGGIGALAGGISGGVAAKKGFLNKAAGALKGAKGMGKTGMLIGGAIAGGVALHKRSKQARDNQFYNDRLEYAQRQAQRRERKDWKQNMTQREDYTY